MKKIGFLLFILFTSTAIAQRFNSLDDDKDIIDSLVFATQKTKSDSVKCLYSFKLSSLYRMNKNPEKVDFYLKQANQLAPKNSFLKAIAIFYNSWTFAAKGDVKGYENELNKANKLLEKFDSKEAFRYQTMIYQNCGVLKQMQNNETGFMDILVNKAIPVSKKSEDVELQSVVLKGVGVAFMNNKNNEKANFYLQQAANLIDKTAKKSSTLQENKVEIFVTYAENLLELEKINVAKIYIDKAKVILKNHPDSNLNYLYYYSEGVYFFKIKNYLEAIKSYDKGIECANLFKESISLNRLKFAKYSSLFKLAKYNEAKNVLSELISTDKTFLIDNKNYYNELAITYSKLGDSKNAYYWSQKYIQLSDSLYDSKFQKDVVELEAKYNKAENENKIIKLKSQKEKIELKAKNSQLNSWLFGSLALFLLLGIGFLWNFYRNQKKLSVQNETILNQEIESLENRKKTEVVQALLQGEDVERKRIARDLHDGLGSMLSGLKLNFSEISYINSIENSVNFSKVTTQLNNSITELRSISQNLMPETLIKLGLESALRDLCVSLSSKKTEIEFQSNAIQKNSIESEQITIYRIIQEIVNNALKHSEAKEILVSCSQNENIFFITIEDDGKGFDTNLYSKFNGMGLKNIKNRVEFLRGKLEVDSDENRGTIFSIELKLTLI